MSIEAKQAEIAEEFSLFDDWQEKLQLVIDTGETLKPMASELQTEEHRIHGCQNKVYLASHMENGLIHYQGSSEAQIPRGLLALLIRLVNDEKPEEVVQAKLDVFEKVGIKDTLSMQRAVGLESMIRQVKLEAARHIHS